MKLENARILLTGATGGLGRELARQLAASGAAVLLAGRDAARLEALRASLGARASLVVADLTRAEGVALMTRAAQDFGVNVLINNAGTSAFGMLENQPWPTIEEVLATSLEAPIHLTHALLPWLKAQPQAAIVNVGSTLGSLPFAGFAAYSAAKAGLRAFSQALRRELADAQNVPPYVVFADAVLRALCEALPTNEEELLTVPGVGQVKLERYGRQFLKVLRDWKDSHESL